MELIIALVVLGFLVLYLIVSYNRLINARNKVREAFSAIDVYLLNRFDTLTKVAEAVVSYAEHERNTLQKVTELRQSITPKMSEDDKIATYNQLDKMIRGINIQVENYPDLKASENFLHLQRTINDIESKLSASRRTYNANVTLFNTMIETIPTNIFAKYLGFTKKNLLETEDYKREDVNLRSILRG